MKTCTECGIRPAMKNRSICNSCRKKRYNKGKKKDDFYVETPHKIIRQRKIEDNFNGIY